MCIIMTLRSSTRGSGEQDKAVVEMRRTAELCGTEADRMMFHAAACKIAGDMRGAIEWEKKAVAQSPDEALHHDHLTEFFLELGEYENAIAAETKAMALASTVRSDSSENMAFHRYIRRADAYAALKMYREALADYDRGVELAPFRSFSYLHRAATHFKLGNRSQALADLAKAIELKPDDLNALTWIPLQHVADCPDQQFCNGFLEPVDNAVRLNNQSAEARIARATILAEMGQRDRARAELNATVGEIWILTLRSLSSRPAGSEVRRSCTLPRRRDGDAERVR